MVPTPLYWARAPAIVSQSKAVATKLRPAAWNWNSVLPLGRVAPFWYFDTKPNVALPVSDGFVTYAPTGELIQPPPVTKPAVGSYTTTYCVAVLVPDSPPSSVTVTEMM